MGHCIQCNTVRGNMIGRRLTEEEAHAVLKVARSRVAEPGEVIFRRGEDSDGCYLVLTGQIEISQNGHMLATLDAPTVIGEMSLLTAQKRSATAKAVPKSELLHIPKAEFTAMLDSENISALKVVRSFAEIICDRLRAMDERLSTAANAKPEALLDDLARVKKSLFSDWAF